MIKSCIGRRSCRKPFRYVVQEKSAGERSASDIRQQHRRETILLHLSYVVKYPMTITNQTSKIRIHRCQSRMNPFKRIRFISHEVSTDIWQDLVCPQIGQPFKFNSWCVDHFGSVRWSFGPVSNNGRACFCATVNRDPENIWQITNIFFLILFFSSTASLLKTTYMLELDTLRWKTTSIILMWQLVAKRGFQRKLPACEILLVIYHLLVCCDILQTIAANAFSVHLHKMHFIAHLAFIVTKHGCKHVVLLKIRSFKCIKQQRK